MVPVVYQNLDLVPSLPKVHKWSLWFALVTHLVTSFFQKYMDGPYGLHFLTHLVPTWTWICWLGTKCVTKCKPHGPSVYFWKARDQIQNFGKPQGPSVYLTLNFIICLVLESMRHTEAIGSGTKVRGVRCTA
ncbi:hypothetical protein Hanom_Chr15g01395661 [Helianthus anomalus]